jgi:D-arabinose 1-dehydrogenase-like Zn-dependent alcohol dehydrogenase
VISLMSSSPPTRLFNRPATTSGRSLQGWASGAAADIEETLAFAELTGVRAMIETYPLEKADEAYARMMRGKTQFRVVLTM